MIFDLKMEYTRKVLYVATGCHAPKYYESHYSGVVTWDIVLITFTYDAINRIDILADDIHNFLSHSAVL